MRQTVSTDLHRPRYHFLPPSNWMNDPNGVIQWKGRYHLFYQHNPFGALWGNIHWGHAVSDDLIHWDDLPLALAPTPDSPDEFGVFSGCAVDHDGVPTLIYTGATRHAQSQCLATSRDDLLTWQKYAGNPVLAKVPEITGQTDDFRDPFVWREPDGWYMALASRIRDVGGVVFLYRSPNLIDWEYLHPLLTGDAQVNGVVWECPNFFPLGEKWVLMVSSHTGVATDKVITFVGSYADHEFTVESTGVFDYGHLYAPLTMRDHQERRILFGWLREARSETDQRSAGWSGVQSIPRVLTLDDQRRVCMTPVPELEAIRGAHHHCEGLELNGEHRLELRGRALDIAAEFAPGGRCGIALTCSADGRERTEIVYEAGKLIVRRVYPESDGALVTHVREVPHLLAAGEPLSLRVLLDGSVVEIIANQRTSLTSRVYPLSAESDGVRLLGANARLNWIDLWEMPSIW